MPGRTPAAILAHMRANRIVIAGGGVAALEAALSVSQLGGEGVSATVLTPTTKFVYPAHAVVEPFGAAPGLSFALADVLADTGVELRTGALARVAPDAHEITTASGESLGYDGLLIAVGGTPVPAYDHGVTFDQPHDPEPFAELLEDVRSGLAGEVAFLVPEAQGWALPAYELALVLRGWARRDGIRVGIRIVTPEPMPLEMFGPEASAAVAETLDRAEVAFHGGGVPTVVSDTAMLVGNHWHAVDRIVSLPRLEGPHLPGLPADGAGFVLVDEEGAVPGCPGVYAAGDGTAHRRKQGGLAAQQADRAARALLRAGAREVPEAPTPLHRGVLATPDGPLFLTAMPDGSDSVASWEPLWDPPTKVATTWLGPHLDQLVRRRTAAFAA